MGGRGRGRGRGSTLSFNLDVLGVQRGEITSTSGSQPRPLFPPLQRTPVPLPEIDGYQQELLEIKRRMYTRFQQSSHFHALEEKKRDVERYSDKYQLNRQDEKNWTPDWSMFPAELRPPQPKKKKKLSVRPNLKVARNATANTTDILERTKKRLQGQTSNTGDKDEELDKDEEDDDEDEDQEAEDDEEEEVLDEEEETDYNQTYFDNGEGYGDDDDEDEEPAYS